LLICGNGEVLGRCKVRMKTAEKPVEKKACYTMGELMVAAAAREICDREVVFVGMRLPLIAFVVAKKTHAPGAIGLFENGVIRATPSPELIYTMADPPNLYQATQCLDMLGVMSLLQSGRVDLGFLGAAEVDRFGNLNSTEVSTEYRVPSTEKSQNQSQRPRPGAAAPHKIRLPGSGGACDIASLAKRVVVLLEHAKHRLPERVHYVTSPGNGDGAGWRDRVGLPRGGPSAAITTKCVLRFGEDGEAYLDSVHPGVTVEDVVANTGWKLKVASSVKVSKEPTAEELRAIREYDREGFWTG
jgi:glutaconate CoA-transferase, subunit B